MPLHNDVILDIITPKTLTDNIFEFHSKQRTVPQKPPVKPVKVRGSKTSSNNNEDEEEQEMMAQSAQSAQKTALDVLLNSDVDSRRRDDCDRLSVEDSESLLVQLEDKYIHPFKTLSGVELRKHMEALFELDKFQDRPYVLKDIQAGYKINLHHIYRVYLLFVEYNMVGDKTDKSIYYLNTFNRLMQVVYQMNHILMGEYYLHAAIDGTSLVGDELNLFRFTPQDYTNNGPFQNLLIFVLNMAYTKGYRLYRKACYSQIYHDGYPTHAWKYECAVESFIYQCVDKETNFAMWQNLTQSKDNAKRAADYLMSAHDKEFPTLEPLRYVWSFTNGVYNAKEMTFYPYDTHPLPSSIVSIKFFDMPFQADLLFSYDHWTEIPTPDFDSILTYQKLPPEVISIIYVMMGRCLYNVNDLDHWEVILFIKGVAGSGKSTIGKFLKSLYPSDDVAILSSNIEKKFGLDAVYNKLLYMCLEVKHNFGLDQGDFQSMISGEEMSIAIKHKTALSTVWTVPGLLMGNEYAEGWVDASGSMTRRLMLVDFKVRVQNSDTTLMSRLRQSTPAMLHKINMAYQLFVQTVGRRSVWEVLPKYFIEMQDKLKKDINPLKEFLESVGDVNMQLAADLRIPFDDFRTAYVQYCRKNQYRNIRLNEDHYRTVFDEYSLRVTPTENFLYNGKMKNVSWIVGIGPREDTSASG